MWETVFDWLHDIATELKTIGLTMQRQYTTIQNQVHIGQQNLEEVYARLDILSEQVQALRNKPCNCVCTQPYQPYKITWGDLLTGEYVGPWTTVSSSDAVQGGVAE